MTVWTAEHHMHPCITCIYLAFKCYHQVETGTLDAYLQVHLAVNDQRWYVSSCQITLLQLCQRPSSA